MPQFETYAAEHIGQIRALALGNIDCFERAARVCMLSARRPFDIVGDVVRDVETVGIELSRWPSQAQRRGLRYLSTEREVLRDYLARYHHNPTACLEMATRVPALGLAKGGFLCQMLGVDVGCLDTHNVDKYALSRDKLRLNKEARLATRMRHIGAYVNLCQRLGGSHYLWGAWCEYVADLYPDVYRDGRDVSARHVAYVDGVPF